MVWSPYFRSFTVKRNNNKYSDPKLPFNHKISTFDGSALHCTTESLTSPHTVAEIEGLCSLIVKHVAEISGNSTRVSQMTLYLEVDRDNKMWLCFCSRFKVRRKYSGVEQAVERRLSPVLRYQPVVDPNHVSKKDIVQSGEGNTGKKNGLKRCCVCEGRLLL